MTTSYESLHSVLALAIQRAEIGVERLLLNDGQETDGRRQTVCKVSVFPDYSSSPNSNQIANAEDTMLPQPDDIPFSEFNTIPLSIDSVNPDLLRSGVAVYLGCCDKTRDAAVALIYCKHPAWITHFMSITHLSSLLVYYQHLSRKQLTLIVDARGATREIVRTLLETISELEVRRPGVVDIVHILVDRISQALILRSPFFRNTSRIHASQIDLLTNVDVMYRVVDREHLPVEIGGHLHTHHLHWVHFRQEYEMLMTRCADAGTVLMQVAKLLSLTLPVVRSVTEVNELIRRHLENVEGPLKNLSVTLLQAEAKGKLQKLRDNDIYLSDSTDYRESMGVIVPLVSHLEQSVDKLSHLAHARIQKLNICLQVRNFEEQQKQVMHSLDVTNKEVLNKYLQVGSLSEDLFALKLQLQEFSQFEQTTKIELSKGGDLLVMGNRIMDVQDSWAVTIVQQYYSDLQRKMDELTLKLEQAKQKMDVVSRCCQVLEKAYHWMEEAAKLITDVSLPKDISTSCDLDKLTSDVDNCRHRQPFASCDVFQNLIEDCRRFGILHMEEKCLKIQNQYSEVIQLIKSRQDQLRSQKEKFRKDKILCRRPLSGSIAADESDIGGFLRRRSYAGKPSTSMCSPHVEAFKRRDVDIQEYEEYLFSEGLITDNMSERIVTSLPKGLSDVTMRGSRESLKSSKESLQGSQESVVNSGLSCESLTSASACRDGKSDHQTFGTALGKPWRMFKKAVSFLADGNNRTSSAPSSSSLPAVSTSSESLEFSAKRTHEENPPHWFPANSSTPLTHCTDETNEGKNRSANGAEDATRRLRSLSHVMTEMIQTERDYVRALEFVIINYIPEMDRDDVVQPLRGKRNVLFGNIEKIYEFHKQLFLSGLEQCQAAPLQVGATFLHHASSFYLYALYNKNKPKSDALMDECGSAFFRRKQQELGERLDLSSYLLKPVQRMGKYALLLEELIKECSDADSEYGVLKEALEMVRFQLRHGNDLLAMDCIRRCDVNLQEQGRLLLQDSFSVTQGRHKMDRHIFLFEDTILFTKPKRHRPGIDWLDYKNSFKLSDIGLTENANDGRRFEIWFRRQTPDMTYVMEAPSPDVKRSWVNCLSRLLWKQAIRNRQNQRNELADMWHDAKPAIDLGQSSNSIHDRTVSVTMRDKLSRIRNSIAVPSSDRYRTGCKRPHSVISSSSSGSSYSSGYHSNLSTTFELPSESGEVKEDGQMKIENTQANVRR